MHYMFDSPLTHPTNLSLEHGESNIVIIAIEFLLMDNDDIDRILL